MEILNVLFCNSAIYPHWESLFIELFTRFININNNIFVVVFFDFRTIIKVICLKPS